MIIKESMSHTVMTVEMDDTLATIRTIFTDRPFHHLLVTEKSRLVGVISDRDALKWISPTLGTVSETTRDLNILRKRAHQIMTRNPLTVNWNDSLERGAETLLASGFSCLPVVDEHKHVKGIVTWKDFLHHYVNPGNTSTS